MDRRLTMDGPQRIQIVIRSRASIEGGIGRTLAVAPNLLPRRYYEQTRRTVIESDY